MTTNEIIIGGWYLLDGKPIKAEGYSRGNVFYHTGYECGLYELEPIPLTEDILKANGFEMKENNHYYIGESFKWSATVALFDDGIVITITNEFDRRGVNNIHICDNGYVHILQYDLRLCGLNDLADNFKINITFKPDTKQ